MKDSTGQYYGCPLSSTQAAPAGDAVPKWGTGQLSSPVLHSCLPQGELRENPTLTEREITAAGGAFLLAAGLFLLALINRALGEGSLRRAHTHFN